jgi:lysophospholipid acyltransferase (LPLAT)-like uncharacterized protein
VTLSRRKQIEAKVIAAVATPIVEALGCTFTWHARGAQHWDEIVRAGRQPILALWHGRIFAATLYFRDRGIVAMTSENFDGEWVARLMGRFGYAAARGSTSRGGARALVQLRRELEQHRPVAFTVDGPRGPARIAQPGAAWLAGATGQPILPFHIEASTYWTAKSWDQHQVPKPGSRVAVAIGAPIEIAGTDAGTVEAGRVAIERALAQLEREARVLVEPSKGHS